jgi:hypothetical protein
MEVDASIPAYEVRCAACDCSFAAGTKQCVHCGAPLGARFDLARLGAAPADAPAGPDAEGGPSIGRFLIWAISAAVAVLAHAANTCADR